MSIIDSVRKSLVPIHPEGYIFIAGFAIVAFLAHWISARSAGSGLSPPPGASISFAIRRASRRCAKASWSRRPMASSAPLAFFPRRRTWPWSRADAARLGVHERLRLPREPRADHRAHSQIAYKPGLFVNADLDKASEDNERNGLVIEAPQGRFGVVQIAGLVARRIVCFIQEGENIGVGDRFGLIRFGSRVDVYMPTYARPRWRSARARSPARPCSPTHDKYTGVLLQGR